MTPERWQAVREALAAIRRLDPGPARDEILRLRGDDPELAAEVESLLAHGEAADRERLLEPATEDDFDPDDARGEALPPGTRIGPYIIRRLLGRGGMGAVYLADRVEPYTKPVAVKLIDARLSPSLARRFDTERQLLAGLEHPHIVRLLDGGTTDGGVPYLVMEYIDGEPLHHYCERKGLTVVERVRLLHTLAGAVAYAHEQGVLHRDLSPSNLLVTRNGIPAVTDFGLARSLGGDPRTAITRPGAAAGTPGYTAPEQFAGGPGRNRPGVDVYGLGAVLYRLLTDHTPFEAVTPLETWIRAGMEDPTPPRRLNPAIPRELETIVLKAMARDPAERFAEVEELAEQLRRFLAGEPLTIQPPSPWTRLNKWAHRHRVPILACVAGALVVLTVMSGLLLAGNRDLRQSREALGELLGHVSRANEDLLQNLPPGSDRTHAYFENMVGFFEEALRQAGRQADPALRRRTGLMHHNLARSAAERSDPAGAVVHFSRALELLRPLPPLTVGRPEHSWIRFDIYRCLQSRGMALISLQQLEAALADAREGLRVLADLSRDEPRDVNWLAEYGNQHRILAVMLTTASRLQEAERHAREAIAIAERAGRAEPGESRHLFKRYWAHQALTSIHDVSGQRDAMVADARAAKGIADELLRRRPGDWEARSVGVEAYQNLANALLERGEHREAEALLDEAAGLSRALLASFPENDGFLIRDASVWSTLGAIRQAGGRAESAEKCYRVAIARLEEICRKRPGRRDAREQLARIYEACPVESLRNAARAAELREAAGTPGPGEPADP